MKMILVDALAGEYLSAQQVRSVPILNQFTHKAAIQDSFEAACL